MPDKPLPRLAIVGVGQLMRGDDGAGSTIVRRLAECIDSHGNLLILDAGHAPENCLGLVIRFRPDTVLFVDTVRATELPGTLLWFPAAEVGSTGGSTHTLSLGLLSEYLNAVTGASVYILGIQPASIEFGEGLSAPVKEAIEHVVDTIINYWRSAVAACSAISTGEFSVVKT